MYARTLPQTRLPAYRWDSNRALLGTSLADATANTKQAHEPRKSTDR